MRCPPGPSVPRLWHTGLRLDRLPRSAGLPCRLPSRPHRHTDPSRCGIRHHGKVLSGARFGKACCSRRCAAGRSANRQRQVRVAAGPSRRRQAGPAGAGRSDRRRREDVGARGSGPRRRPAPRARTSPTSRLRSLAPKAACSPSAPRWSSCPSSRPCFFVLRLSRDTACPLRILRRRVPGGVARPGGGGRISGAPTPVPSILGNAANLSAGRLQTGLHDGSRASSSRRDPCKSGCAWRRLRAADKQPLPDSRVSNLKFPAI